VWPPSCSGMVPPESHLPRSSNRLRIPSLSLLSTNEHRDAQATARALQDDLEKLERETVQSTTDLRSLRKSHGAEKRSVEEARTSKQRVEAALEDVREYLNSQGLGSGLVVAFQNAIEVPPSYCRQGLTRTGSQGQEKALLRSNPCNPGGSERKSCRVSSD
jgi:hypothetical protein